MNVLPVPDWDALCNELLTLIEFDEAKLLNWGFFDVRSNLQMTMEGYADRLSATWKTHWKEALQQGLTSEKALQNLIDRRLVFAITIAGRTFYRTRFAETLRLLSLLRQRFSPHDWNTASRLVSDLKIQLQRRRYPRRDFTPDMVLQEIRNLHVTPLYLEALKHLLISAPEVSISLARFQKDAIVQQIKYMRSRGERAITIGTGTGSGKTKAFYLPTLAEIASRMSSNPHTRWVQAIAIYPRTELLKDQLQEAFSEARKLDKLLSQHKKRNIVIAAYFSDVPKSADDFLTRPPESWQENQTRDGWICPFFSCPYCHSQELTWYRKDIKQEQKENQKGNFEGRNARLICPNPQCRHEITSQHLLLTREQMLRYPPDILFTTTEMLNRRMSRANEHRLFGLSPHHQPPYLVLLDEIHTYEGTHGAQIAYLLRRWKYARRQNSANSLCFVGLSATLTNAEAFFAKLTGLPVYHVSAIAPREQDFLEEGLEYNLVLKGDPVSGTSLLSTSVQTVMLLGRMLDADAIPSEKAVYGKKIFAFADKLDVLNRWYHIEYEAEIKRTLSQYRDYSNPINPEIQRKIYLQGQDWRVCKQLGHNLRAPLRIDLTSSQYRGVNSRANLIVATSTLEVGFNDPDVGMVIQHKAPRSIASFVQRKGRAGRQRHMRPWMVVVTSAYGRDRWAFQHTEHLFNPQLEVLNLPIENYYVGKIQATYALMDWLASVLAYEQGDVTIDIWRALSNRRGSTDLQKERQNIQRLLEELLRGKRRTQFQRYLREALDIREESTLQSVLWGEPRSLFFEVIPTIIRQLATNWQTIQKDGKLEQWVDTPSNNPLPDFITPNLFSDLNLPELLLHIPEHPAHSRTRTVASTITMREDAYLPLAQALQEFAPGHVNKRYSRRDILQEAHWIALPETERLKTNSLPLSLLSIEYSSLAAKRVVVDQQEYQVFQPRAYSLSLVPGEVKNSSSGRLIWRTAFEPRYVRDQAPIPDAATPTAVTEHEDAGISYLKMAPGSPWLPMFHSIKSYTQANGQWVEITRFAIGVDTETYYKGSKELRRTLIFEEHGSPASLGFTIYADALCFTCEPLNVEQILTSSDWPALYQHLGPEFFLYKLQHDQRLHREQLTTFEIQWLWQLELSMLVTISVAQKCSLQAAALIVYADRPRLAERAMKVIFQSLPTEDEGEEERVGRLHKKLITQINNPVVQAVLGDHGQVLWQWTDSGFSGWLQSCYISSLGSTILATLIQLVPDINTESLLMDVDGNNIWISEETSGGIGLVSRLAEAISLHPGEFDLQMQDILEYCEREQLAHQLYAVARLVKQQNTELISSFARLREHADIPQQLKTRHALTHTLEQHGIPATRSLIVALNAKFLRPNSSQDTDQLIATLAHYWQQEEQRIGSAIDLRVMAVAALRIPELRVQVEAVLKRIGEGSEVKIEESQIFNLLQSLLWMNCNDSCPDCIQNSQPYQEFVRPSRSLLRSLLQKQSTPPILYDSYEWKERLERALESRYQAQISCSYNALENCKHDLLKLLIEPIEIGYQLYYPLVERLTLHGQQWLIHIQIQELLYV